MSGWDIKPEDVKLCPTCGGKTWFGMHFSEPDDDKPSSCPRRELAAERDALRAQLAAAEKERNEARSYEAKYRHALARVESAVSLAGDLGAELQRARRTAKAWKALCREYREPFHGLRPCDLCKRPSSRLTRCGKLEKPTEPVPGGNGFMAWDEDLCPECMKIRDAKFAAGEAWWLNKA